MASPDVWLTRNALLARQLGKLLVLFHARVGHAGVVSKCCDLVCAETLRVLERNEAPKDGPE